MGCIPGLVPYRSKRKQKAATRVSTAKWYKSHKAQRAAYMRKYRRRLKRSRGVRKPASAGPPDAASE